MPHLLEPAAAEAARRSATGPDPDGWVRVTIPIESVEQAVPELLRLGADTEILSPRELRDTITETVDALALLHRPRPRGSGVNG